MGMYMEETTNNDEDNEKNPPRGGATEPNPLRASLVIIQPNQRQCMYVLFT